MTIVDSIIQSLASNVVVIDSKMTSKKDYAEYIESIFQHLRDGFEEKRLREAPVYYRLHKDSPVLTMQLRHFLTNLMFWEPFVGLGIVDLLDEKHIVDTSKLSSDYIKDYIDTFYITPFSDLVSNKKLNVILADMIYDLSRISNEFSILLGLTVNIETFIDVANKSPRFDEIIHTKVDESLQPSEVEDQLNALTKEEMQILLDVPNPLTPILKVGSGIKSKQLAEMTINGGFKPDISGNTMPVPINTNLLVGGLSSVPSYYIDATAGRKALINNKDKMGSSGYFTRKVIMSVCDIYLREDEDTCTSINPIEYEIKSIKHLKRLIGRYYRRPYQRTYRLLKGDETDLIGTRIMVKSPITCTSHSGICKACYGPRLYHTNKGICVGSYAGTRISNPVGQRILSTKHVLTTDSVTIKFNEKFHELFAMSANEIVVNTHSQVLDDYSIIIHADNIVSLEELNEGELTEFMVCFDVRNNVTNEVFCIHAEDNNEIYLYPDFREILGMNKRGTRATYEMKISDIPDDCKLFVVPIENNELTKPLYALMGLLDNKKAVAELGIKTVNDMAQRMLDLLIESKINVPAVHGEILLYPLIRDENDILNRPDFSKYLGMDQSTILTVSSVLEKNPSPLIGLAFGYLERQLKTPLTYEKTGKSYIDPFFRK